jgi:aminocarboxymuconate-semialdehyde decarboxylase
VIDLHAHVVLEDLLGAAGDLGPELDEGDADAGRPPCFRVGGYRLEGVRYRGTAFMDVDVRLAAMDAAGIELQVLSPNPLTYLSHVAPDVAVGFARRHNDALAALVAQHPGRLLGLAQVPVQGPVAAVDEARRAVGELGLVGVAIGTDVGRPLDDPELDRFYDAVAQLDVPLFVHPAPDGIDRPRRDERLARFDADLWLGFAYEETLAVATLVLGGVLDRHPGLDVCISHGGGATSWLAERLAHAAATRPWAPASLVPSGAFEAQLRRLWWDAHVGGPRALDALVATVGDERLVGGTNFAGWDQHLDPGHGDVGLAALLDANARRLLRLDPP